MPRQFEIDFDFSTDQSEMSGPSTTDLLMGTYSEASSKSANLVRRNVSVIHLDENKGNDTDSSRMDILELDEQGIA